jgi:hypothetical protein
MNQSPDADGYMRTLLDQVEMPSDSSLDIDQIVIRGRRRRRAIRTAEVASVVVVAAGVVGVAAAVNAAQNPQEVAHPLPSTSAPASTTSPASSGGGSCAADDLSIRLGQIGGAMGTTYQGVTVKNTGTARCKLSGYASATFTGGDLGQATYQAGDDRGNATTVRIAPQQTATFQLAAVSPDNFPNGCSARTPSRVNIAVPSASTSPTSLRWSEQICTDQRSSVYVTPYVKDAGAN